MVKTQLEPRRVEAAPSQTPNTIPSDIRGPEASIDIPGRDQTPPHSAFMEAISQETKQDRELNKEKMRDNLKEPKALEIVAQVAEAHLKNIGSLSKIQKGHEKDFATHLLEKLKEAGVIETIDPKKMQVSGSISEISKSQVTLNGEIISENYGGKASLKIVTPENVIEYDLSGEPGKLRVSGYNIQAIYGTVKEAVASSDLRQAIEIQMNQYAKDGVFQGTEQKALKELLEKTFSENLGKVSDVSYSDGMLVVETTRNGVAQTAGFILEINKKDSGVSIEIVQVRHMLDSEQKSEAVYQKPSLGK